MEDLMSLVGEKRNAAARRPPSASGVASKIYPMGRESHKGAALAKPPGGEWQPQSQQPEEEGEKGPRPPKRKEGGQAVPMVAVPAAAPVCWGPCFANGNCNNAAWSLGGGRKLTRMPMPQNPPKYLGGRGNLIMKEGGILTRINSRQYLGG